MCFYNDDLMVIEPNWLNTKVCYHKVKLYRCHSNLLSVDLNIWHSVLECHYILLPHSYGSLSKYTHFFLFIFWWHQIFSFTFFFSCLVFPTLQWYIHIICSRENHHDKNYFKICCTPSYLSVRGVTNIKLFFARKINNNFYVKSG